MSVRSITLKAPASRWWASLPLIFLPVLPGVLYAAGKAAHPALGLLCVALFCFAGLVSVGRIVCLATYRLTLNFGLRGRIEIYERRFSLRVRKLGGQKIQTLRLVQKAGQKPHLEVDLEGTKKPLTLGWEIGLPLNRRLFRLLKRYWGLESAGDGSLIARRK